MVPVVVLDLSVERVFMWRERRRGEECGEAAGEAVVDALWG